MVIVRPFCHANLFVQDIIVDQYGLFYGIEGINHSIFMAVVPHWINRGLSLNDIQDWTINSEVVHQFVVTCSVYCQ